MTKIIVGVSDARISRNPADILATYSLGSCIAICLYDPAVHVGGMLHYQLPDSTKSPDRAIENPLMFADTGMQFLCEKLAALGADKKRIRVKLAGGAQMSNAPQGFDIGKRNYLAMRKILWKCGMFIDGEDVGGYLPRNMYMTIATGSVAVKSDGLEKSL